MAERWWTRVDVFDIVYHDYQLDPLEEHHFERSVGEEPLRLMAHVAVNDLPWTEIVTADYTLANEMLLDLWPLQERETGQSGWRTATWTDGRPAAGVLATNGLWWRYITNRSNMNRARAAAISRLLLCEDMLARPISFAGSDVDLSDLETAISTSA